MLKIKKIDHIGIRVHNEKKAEKFYEMFGFKTIWSGDFQKNEPVIMENKGAGIVINLLGPADRESSPNILQDVKEKYAGYTHIALTVESIEATEAFMKKNKIEIAEKVSFGSTKALFIRDPDLNVIEFDENKIE